MAPKPNFEVEVASSVAVLSEEPVKKPTEKKTSVKKTSTTKPYSDKKSASKSRKKDATND